METDIQIYADEVSKDVKQQIHEISESEAFEGAKIRIMPDVHTGSGLVVGFTAHVNNGRLAPESIGTDIGCGVSYMPVDLPSDSDEFDFMRLDRFVHSNIPSGQKIHRKGFTTNLINDGFFKGIYCYDDLRSISRLVSSTGTLGGGNHFIEIDKDESGQHWIVVHSGSRSFGVLVSQYYSMLAMQKTNAGMLSYLEDTDAEHYLYDMRKCIKYAQRSRTHIVQTIVQGAGFRPKRKYPFDIVHNYIEQLTDGSFVIRKGAISAKANETVILPLNMQRGCIIGKGKGNPDWNCSAPHGAGRRISRSEALRTLSVDDFREQMESVYTSSANITTLDEAPEAYKDADSIIEAIYPSVGDIKVLKPVYSFKAHDDYQTCNWIRRKEKAYGKTVKRG